MKKNKLYTVNKWNKPAFMFKEGSYNPYDIGGFLQGLGDKTGTLGSVMGGGKIAGSPMGGIVSGLGSAVGKIGGDLISGGLSSGAGSAVSNIGGTVGGLVGNINPVLGGIISAGSGILGGVTNALFGEGVDEEKLNAAKEGTASLNSFTSNASTFDDIKGPQAVANVQDAYKGGLFSSGSARRKNEELKRQRAEAKMFADRSIFNNVNNLVSNQLNDALANYSAYGGPLDSFGSGALGIMQNDKYLTTIDNRSNAIANRNTNGYGLGAYTGGAKTYDEGGQLASAFLDDFATNPIAAAIRYNKGLEQLEAQKEAAAIEAQREADFQAMQQKLSALETQNQGLQALMATQTQPILPEIPASSFTPSIATPKKKSGNSNWDYIEDQLRKSGKFNDVQIEGIKYNLQRESSIDPTAVGDGGAAFGLAQWHGKRQPKDRSLEGQTQHLIDTLSDFDGKEHWIGRGNYEGFMNARTPEEAHYWIAKGYERPMQSIVNKVKRDSDMSLRRLNAFGGELGTNGTDFTNGLLYIGEGGSHEDNPMDGVLMGVDAEGVPNLVEEGETVYNDYVFSDRMMVPDFMYKELGLSGKKKGISFADASKKLAQESEKRPNDPISQAGLQASLGKLAEIQETERMKKQAEEYMGLEGYACGGKMNKKYACGGKKGKMFLGWGDQPNQFTPWLPEQKKEGFIGLTPSEMQRLAEMQMEATNNTPSSTEKVVVPVSNKSSNHNYGKGTTSVSENTPSTPLSKIDIEEVRSINPILGLPKVDIGGNLDRDKIETRDTGNTEEGYNPYPTWMRYAPAFGAGLMTVTDALGLTNRPDYSYADKLEAAAERAGYAPDIKYDPIGDYMRYNPLDRQYYINQLMANSRATDRYLSNTSSPSKAAGLLANGYNTTLSLGNLARQAEEYNRAQYERTKEFNRKTNMFNSQMGLEAAMANARYRQQASQMGLSGLAQAAALRDSIDARIGASRSANLTNFLTSLGNIGRENFALNQINFDRSRRHGARANGTSYDKVAEKRACGGKMNRNKK